MGETAVHPEGPRGSQDIIQQRRRPKRPNTELIDDENPEWTVEDFRRARPAAEVLPPELLANLPKRKPGQRGPQRAPVKKKISLRVDAEVLARFKATGPGWQTRVNDALKNAAFGKPSLKGRAA